MCGISGIIGKNWDDEILQRMLRIQHHRGPDAQDIFINEDHIVGLAHNRLSIIDLSDSGKQPMCDTTGRYWLVFNGEVYNYLEIKLQLDKEFSFRTRTDSEVVLYSFIKWGPACLDKFIGMFAFAIWDNKENTLFAARDRFGVKPFHYAFDGKGNFLFASEIKTLFAGGAVTRPNEMAWASYLQDGKYDHADFSFWQGISKLMPGHHLTFKDEKISIIKWYDLAEKTGIREDNRPIDDIIEEYFSLMQENIIFRFRADVPVGINISGGLDSSALLGLVDKVQGEDSVVKAFTFITGDARYDELPWVNQMIGKTKHPLSPVMLRPEDVPALAESVQYYEDEPFGGIPNLAYARIFEEARKQGILVLLDGQGMDEQWAGYDYYRKASTTEVTQTVQGSKDSPVRPECLDNEFRLRADKELFPKAYPDSLRNLQYRDTFFTKIPRALRFNDRISMRSSTELREPFLDHRLFELAFRQTEDKKIHGEQGKWLLRLLLSKHLPGRIVEAPKRPLQTPQREWLREELKEWAEANIEGALNGFGGSWFKKEDVWRLWNGFLKGESDNSFYVWQWINLGLMRNFVTPYSNIN